MEFALCLFGANTVRPVHECYHSLSGGQMAATRGDYVWDFFIAHAGPDRDAAHELWKELSSTCRVFLDAESLEYGDDWDLALPEAQRNSRVTVVLVSGRTEKAYYLREEIAAAIAMTREDKDRHRVVPVYLDIPPFDDHDVPYGDRKSVA